MQAIESCILRQTDFLFITNSMWKHAPRVNTSPHNLLFVTEGVLYIELDGVRYTVRSGEFLFLPQSVPSVGYRPSGVPTGFFFATFRTNTPPALPPFFSLPNQAPIRSLYTQLIRAARSPDYPAAGTNALLHALLHEVVYQLHPSSLQHDQSLAEDIKKYVQLTVFRNLTVNDVAAHFGHCSDYINRVFSRTEHITLGTYITRLKIERINQYLLSDSTPIRVIAEQMHFPSPSALTKFYKYHTGQTPEAYRAQFVR